jgi:hypothetical protein
MQNPAQAPTQAQAQEQEPELLDPLSSYTVDELKQLLAMTREAYHAYVSHKTESGKIGAKFCAEEIIQIEAEIASRSTIAGGETLR